MNRYIFILGLCPFLLQAQIHRTQLTDCQQHAAKHFPMIREKELLQKIAADKEKNLSTERWPQNKAAAQATYQSAVPTLPISLPGISVPSVDKDQFRITDETDVLLYDGGKTTARKALVRAQSLAEQQKTEVDLYALNLEVTTVYANILKSDTRIDLLKLLNKNIGDRMVKVQAGVAAGTSLAGNLLVLQAEQLGVNQKLEAEQSDRQGLIDVMNIYTGDSLDSGTYFVVPAPAPLRDSIARPEMALFDYQKNSLLSEKKVVEASHRPVMDAFFQGGVGRPGLNILDNNVKGFYITGLKMSWSLGSYYTLAREKRILDNQQAAVETHRENFGLKIAANLARQKEQINKIQGQLKKDNEVIAIRTKVRDISSAQLDAGIITSSDYLIELNAQNEALVNQKIHEVDLVFAYIEYNLIAG